MYNEGTEAFYSLWSCQGSKAEEEEQEIEVRRSDSEDEVGDQLSEIQLGEELEAGKMEYSGNSILWFYFMLCQHGKMEGDIAAATTARAARLKSRSCECSGWTDWQRSLRLSRLLLQRDAML